MSSTPSTCPTRRRPVQLQESGEIPAVEYLTIPDLLVHWPWSRKINPLYEEVTVESDASLRTFKPFTPESHHSFDKCDLGRLSAMIISAAPRDHLRVCCDLNNINFLIDEYTDVESASMARCMVDICIDATIHPDEARPEREVVLGEILRQYDQGTSSTLEHMLTQQAKVGTSQGLKHLRETFLEYLRAVGQTAKARDQGGILDVNAFLSIRLDDAGVRPLCVMGELLLSIPDNVFYYPLVTQLQYCISELVVIDNDILSYSREHASGLVNFNYITVVMHEHALDRDGAIRWLVNRIATLEDQCLRLLRRLDGLGIGPAQGGELEEYYAHLGQVRRACYDWSFECQRYFGVRGPEFERTRRVPIIPRQKRDKQLTQEKVDVMLIEEAYKRLLGPANGAL
ncbi:isoprenoid synthase domain-containing protein [Daedaleopsis nitida]|nr:isoprenoid synthase domain-containing protein [Daedaleopsis nitida]